MREINITSGGCGIRLEQVSEDLAMSYFPILSAPDCLGWTTIFNFAPNNWEEVDRVERFLNVTWSDGSCWHTHHLSRLQYGESKTVRSADVIGLVPADCLPLLSLTATLPVETVAKQLPLVGGLHTHYPAWRATLGLTSTRGVSTSYQGELDPFPAPGSLLTFGHFLQFGPEIQNYLLFMNLESNPIRRTGQMEIRKAAQTSKVVAEVDVNSNCVTHVPLDGLGIGEADLSLFICRNMSGIPLYFSRAGAGEYLSLEHSHPPASSVVHGRRWEAHKTLKKIWFAKAVGQ